MSCPPAPFRRQGHGFKSHPVHLGRSLPFAVVAGIVPDVPNFAYTAAMPTGPLGGQMKLETYLNAMIMASYYKEDCEKHTWEYYHRQYQAFRARILRMDAEHESLHEVHRKMITDIDNKLVALGLEGLWND